MPRGDNPPHPNLLPVQEKGQKESVTQMVDTVLDVMRVPASGDPLVAVRPVSGETTNRVECDVLVVGGGMGGVAAALAAARRGRSVRLLEETDWLGGQITSQGVSALDEHEHIEGFGGTRTYYALREAIRDHYRSLLSVPEGDGPFNPGSSWVSRLAFEPRVALEILQDLLAPEIESGRLQVHRRTKATGATVEGDRIVLIRAMNLDDGVSTEFRASYVLDATELGDLLPLTGTEYVVGAESVAETGEPHAQPDETKVNCVQSCTYTFAMERRPSGEDHRLNEPDKYDHYSRSQPYSLRIHVHGGEIYGEESGWLDYQLFEDTPGTKGPLWHYRRLVEAARFADHYERDVTMFNWPGTDYRDKPLVDQTPEAMAFALQDAKRVSLGFAHWLQTSTPNPAGGTGFPNLLLRPDVMGNADGVSKYPYIREGRRIKALRAVVEQDVAIDHQPGPVAARFADSVGVGWYPIDIHPVSADEVGTSTRTWPFQIPLGALVPRRIENLLAANKNIGTTHITNGCYRLHPVEWNIGEAAGSLAAFALDAGQKPMSVVEERGLLRQFQRGLLADGVPLSWLVDVPVGDSRFTSTQSLVMAGDSGEGPGALEFGPDQAIEADERALWTRRAVGHDVEDPCGTGIVSRAAYAAAMMESGLV